MTPTLSALHIFPVKSCAPLVVDRATVEPRGLAHDRRWIVTDADGRFLTGRQHPRLTLLSALPVGETVLALSAPGMPALRLHRPQRADRIEVTVWKNTVNGAEVGMKCTDGCNHVQAGRDFVNSASAKSGYTAYTYPHPLQVGSTPTDPEPPATPALTAPTNLRAQ